MRSTRLKIIALLSLMLAAPKIFAQSRITNFFAAPQDSQSAFIIATDASSVCVGVTYVHPETGVIGTGTGSSNGSASAASSCLGKQEKQNPTCLKDGQQGCVIFNVGTDVKFSAIDAKSTYSNLKPGNIRRGYTLGGVLGTFPSVATPLDPGTSPPALSTSNVSVTVPQTFLLFGTDGTPYQFKVGKISNGDFIPSEKPTSFLSGMTKDSPTTLYLPFKISGDDKLIPENILTTKTILGVSGTSVPRNLFKAETTTHTTVKNSVGASIAKSMVFVDLPTNTRWILMRKTTTTPAKILKSKLEATTLCASANVTVGTTDYKPSTGLWSLPSSKQVQWMLKTGATAPDGLISKEAMFASTFWAFDSADNSVKTAKFPDIMSEPVIEDAATDATANVICVFKFTTSTTGQGNGTGNGPPNPINLAATTPAAAQIALTWSSGGGSTAGYLVSYQQDGTPPTSCSAGTAVPAGSISGTTATVSGLTADTAYSFRVCATDRSTPSQVSIGITLTATTSGNGATGASGPAGGTAFTHKTSSSPVPFTIDISDVRYDLGAHVYLTSDEKRGFAYIFRLGYTGTNAAAEPFTQATTDTTVSTFCQALGANLPTSLLTGFSNSSWIPISKSILDSNAVGFRSEPFIGTINDGPSHYGFGQQFLAYDNSGTNAGMKVYQFSSSTAAATLANGIYSGSIICTAAAQ